MPCDFGDGENASMALESFIVAFSFPFHSRLGASTLHPEHHVDDQDNDHDDQDKDVDYDQSRRAGRRWLIQECKQ